MKKYFTILLLAVVAVLAASCSSGRGFSAYTPNDDAALIFVDSRSYPIDVIVDHQHYHVFSVKKSDIKRTDKLKVSADNMIYVRPGSHDVTVRSRGRLLYQDYLYIAPDATKIIKL